MIPKRKKDIFLKIKLVISDIKMIKYDNVMIFSLNDIS